MNTKNYKDKRAKGLAEVVKAGGGHALSVKKFSEDDGTELVPEIESIDLDVLIKRKTELGQEVADYEELISDVEKLESEKSKK